MMESVAYHLLWLHALKGHGFIFLSTTRSSGDFFTFGKMKHHITILYYYEVAQRLERNCFRVIFRLRHYSSVKPCSPFFKLHSIYFWEHLGNNEAKKNIQYFVILIFCTKYNFFNITTLLEYIYVIVTKLKGLFRSTRIVF